MATKTNIAWADATWNPARGCSKVDKDCLFCFMYRESYNETRYIPDQVVKAKGVFNFPLRFARKESEVRPDSRPLIFTASLTDIFHKDIDEYRHEIWDIIRKCPHLIFQILTKRPERVIEHLPDDWGNGWDNVWIGTSCGSQDSADIRIPILLKIPAKVRFLSLEPMHAGIDLENIKHPSFSYYQVLKPITNAGDSNRPAIDWVIIGGESGNNNGKYKFRPANIKWFFKIVMQCKKYGVPVFVKQLGTDLANGYGLKDRHGTDIDEWPDLISDLKVRQFPV